MADREDDVLDLSRPLAVHLVGVGGAGISAIAVILAEMGHRVSGADVVATGAWPRLAEVGVSLEVRGAEDLFTIPDGGHIDVVAYSTAFPPSPAQSSELEAAGIAVLDRAGILGAICARRSTLAVSGTHGKTSTSAMLATLLAEAGTDPSWLVGATPVTLGLAAKWGPDGGLFVVEADESDGSFETLGSATAVVTNVEEDHLDHWGSIEAIEAAFDRFLERFPQHPPALEYRARVARDAGDAASALADFEAYFADMLERGLHVTPAGQRVAESLVSGARFPLTLFGWLFRSLAVEGLPGSTRAAFGWTSTPLSRTVYGVLRGFARLYYAVMPRFMEVSPIVFYPALRRRLGGPGEPLAPASVSAP